MNFQVKFDINEKIYLRNPESSEVGKLMVKKSIDLIFELGFEQFTFKKLANEIKSTEATIYRYFENKHRLLLYILNWYWCYMEFLVTFKLENVTNKKERLKIIVHLLTHELAGSESQFDYNKRFLNQIVISESSKVYLVKEVVEINKSEVFKPYKDLCTKIAVVISDYNAAYKYPRSLSTTIIETSHHQQFFSVNLPKLTDISTKKNEEFTSQFIEDFLFKVLG
jgi:Bacterial regulatory proteins, tetR family